MKGANPYGYLGKAINNPADFHGREESVGQTIEKIHILQCVSIIGARRIGKTSLLNQISNSDVLTAHGVDPARYAFAYVNCQGYSDEDPQGFYKLMLRKLHAGIRDDRAKRALDSLRTTEPAKRSEFEDAMSEIVAWDLTPVILFDEFEAMSANENLDMNFFAGLRALNDENIVEYVTASQHGLFALTYSTDVLTSNFFNIFNEVRLTSFNAAEAGELVKAPADAAGIPFSTESVAYILALAGYHPFFLQTACYHAFDLHRETQVLDDNNRARLVDRVEDALGPHLQYAWNELTDQQREVMLSWDTTKNDPTVVEIVESLSDQAIVCLTYDEPPFRCGLWDYFVARQHRVAQSEVTRGPQEIHEDTASPGELQEAGAGDGATTAVEVGDVNGGITGSVIAGRDVILQFPSDGLSRQRASINTAVDGAQDEMAAAGSPEANSARGLPADILNELHDVLLECGPFESNESLRSKFVDERIAAWRNEVSEATNPSDRVDRFVADFLDRRDRNRRCVLVLFLQSLHDRARSEDLCYDRLNDMAVKVAYATNRELPPLARHNLARAGLDTPLGPPPDFAAGYWPDYEEASDERALYERLPDGLAAGIFVEALESIKQKDHAEWLPIDFLINGMRSSMAVGRVEHENRMVGTGFLVAPNLILTNAHVVDALPNLEQGGLRFCVSVGEVAGWRYFAEVVEYSPADQLDFALVRLQAPVDDVSPLALSTERAFESQPANILQYPETAGGSMQVALRYNSIVHVEETRLYYATDTEHGSSGSPVFDDRWSVIGLHRAGMTDREDRRLKYANQGVPMTTIGPLIEQFLH